MGPRGLTFHTALRRSSRARLRGAERWPPLPASTSKPTPRKTGPTRQLRGAGIRDTSRRILQDSGQRCTTLGTPEAAPYRGTPAPGLLAKRQHRALVQVLRLTSGHKRTSGTFRGPPPPRTLCLRSTRRARQTVRVSVRKLFNGAGSPNTIDCSRVAR